MLRADPYFLRSLGGTLVQASSYLRDRANRVQRGAEELLQGPTGWRGDAPQAFRTSCSLWRDDMLIICTTMERASSTISQLAYRVEHIEQLRQEARQYENACWDLDPSIPQEQHQLQYLRSRARDLYAAAEMESMAADQQAASAFREMETVEKSLNLMYSPVWQQYERNLLLSKLKGLSKSERMGYYDAELDEEVFLQDFGKMGNDELRAQIRGREERQQQTSRDDTDLVNQGISMGLDFVPVVGNAKSAVEAITGKDYITGEELTKGGRILAAAGIIFGGLKTLGKVGRAADKGLEFARFGSLRKLETGIVDLKKESNVFAEGTGKGPKDFVYSPFDDAGKLKPNVKYKAGEHQYDYETDSLGRIEKFSTGELKLTMREERLPHDSNTPGKEPGDHAGHLAGDRFGGSPEIDNLVSQSSKVNLSEYKKIENEWARALTADPPKHVSVDVTVIYDGDSLRPSGFKITYEIDGRIKVVDLIN